LDLAFSSSGRTISFIEYSYVTLCERASYSATILPPTTGVFLSMHLSVHISCMIGTMAWKNAWKSSVLFFFLVLCSFFASSCFFLLCDFACKKGLLSFRRVMYACCCIFDCLENLPLSRLSHPMTVCLSMSQSCLSYPCCPRILSMALVMESPLKYVSSPSCSMSHNLGSILFLIRLICLMTGFLSFFFYRIERRDRHLLACASMNRISCRGNDLSCVLALPWVIS
jgi:hypothetical protein